MLSSIRVSFGDGFLFSFPGGGGTDSICIASASVSAGWMVFSDLVSAFWLLEDVEGVTGLATCEGNFEIPTSSATSFWCSLEDVLDVGEGSSSTFGAAACGLVDG